MAGEGIEIKAGTLNRYLNECPAAKDIPEKSKAGSKAAKQKAAPKAKAAGVDANDSAPENPKPTLDNLKPDGQITDVESDSSPEGKIDPSPVNEE